MVGKIINKVMETVPQLVGQVTDVIKSLLDKGKGSQKDSAPRRPAVRPRPASSSGSGASPSKSSGSSSSASSSAAPKKKAAAPKKKKASTAGKSSSKSSSAKSAPAAAADEKDVSVSDAALDEMTYKELYSVAQDLEITGRKGMRKAELLKAIKKEKKA